MKKLVLQAVLACTVFLVGCSNNNKETTPANSNNVIEQSEETQKTVVIKHNYGETEVKTNPKKVVVMDLGLLDTLDNAGVPSIIAVPKSGPLPSYLNKFEDSKYENAGGLKDADFEKISELTPDLILITGRLASSYDEFSKIAPTVYIEMPRLTYLDTFQKDLDILATIFTDQKDKFEGSLENLKSRAEKIKEKSKDIKALIVQTNENNVSVSGTDSGYGGVIYNTLGFTPTDDKIQSNEHGQQSSFEYIGSQKPDYIFVFDRSAAINTEGAPSAKDLLNNDIINKMDAVKNGKIFYLDSEIWYKVLGGLTSTDRMFKEIEDALEIK